MHESDSLLRRLHDTYHAPPDADIHMAPPGPVFQQPQPGTADFMHQRLVGSSAPERYIERWDGLGPEGFGAVEILDGRTGQPIARLNAKHRRRLER
jgi:hypothetical protein